jgi:signal transduction histidine kinase
MSALPSPRTPHGGDDAQDTIAAFDRLAHDLRSPLASVRTVLQMLRTPGLDPARTRDLVELADRQLMRAVALADAVGDYARLRNGRLDLGREPIAVSRLLGDVGDRIRGAMPGIALSVAPGDCGDVAADQLRLSQAIALLLEPATRSGKAVSLSAQRVGNEIVVEARADLDAQSNAIPDLLGAALIAAHGGRLSRRDDGLTIALPALS